MPLTPGTRLALRQAQGDLEQRREVGIDDITAQIEAVAQERPR